MAVNLVSPGVKIREVDLTLGRIDQANDQIAAFAGPFQKGPVNVPILIQNEKQLANVFGLPKVENNQNAYWLTASNYLSYGGIMQIVRVGASSEASMKNAYAGIGSTAIVKINSLEDYNNKSSDSLNNFYYAAKNPGSWANDLVVYTIDSAADQIISGINTTSVETTTTEFEPDVSDVSGNVVGGATSITGISTSGIVVGQVVVSSVVSAGTSVTGIGSNFVTLSNPISNDVVSGGFNFDFGSFVSGVTTTGINIQPGYGVSITLEDREYAALKTVETFNGYLKGIITEIGDSSIGIKLVSLHNTDTGEEEYIEYSDNNPLYSIQDKDQIKIINNSNSVIGVYTSYTTKDWYNEQTITIGNNTVYWKNIAERPSTSEFVRANGGKNDEINIIVVDSQGKINGNIGEILEKFTKLSKASDGKITPSQSIYYKDYLRDNSSYLFIGKNENGASTKFSGINNYNAYTSGTWGTPSVGRYFTVTGNKAYTLKYGNDYSNTANDFGVSLSDITTAYSVFENVEEYPINFIISGPSGGNNIFESQAKANYIISLAENRKDCIAVISAHENDVVQSTSNSAKQTNNIIKFFNGVTASTYAVFDSGYKYTYDKYNNKFLYLACNSDVAGLMARTSINQYPWVSPAGASRGVLNNAIKLAYNPTEAQRDLLYTNKINPVISSPGQGIILYGDKTASAAVSAFDRINVRRLFLTIERTIERAARAQLFEFNDQITRSSFINIVEPYLRDVRAKRGITDFLLICDETNNTPDIIDSNQFRADIYVKPARVINFIGLTFVATRTGVSFTEIVGTV
jgi:hypothetical protein